MESMKYQSGGSSSSSFTETLFGPKEGTISSSGHFGSVFGPSSMGLGKDYSYSNYTRSSNKQDFRSPKCSTDCKTQRINGQKESNPVYQVETTEPSYLSSSIYYGGQESMFILQQATTLALISVALKKAEAMKALMEALLQEEIGGKDLYTTETPVFITAIVIDAWRYRI